MLSDKFVMDGKGKKSVELTSLVTNPDKWTCETPVLYNLKLEKF
jgi:beta-galactosidase/beta-glucuronidase